MTYPSVILFYSILIIKCLKRFIGTDYREDRLSLLHAWCRSGANAVPRHGNNGFNRRFYPHIWDPIDKIDPHILDRRLEPWLLINWLEVRVLYGSLSKLMTFGKGVWDFYSRLEITFQ